MFRKLFTLLVLLTGLAALGQPAQARVLEADSTRSSAIANYASVVQAGTAAAHLSLPCGGAEARPLVAGTALVALLPVPTVRLQADRARE